MYKLPLHVGVFSVLWLVALILYLYARMDVVMAAIDGATLYVYSKPIMNGPAAQNAPAKTTNFLNTDVNTCKDMSKWKFPSVAYVGGAGAGPKCDIRFTTGPSLLPGTTTWDSQKVNITSIDISHAVNCTNGLYQLTTSGGTNTLSIALTVPVLSVSGVSPHQVIVLLNTSFGGSWQVSTAAGSFYTVCMAERTAVAAQILGNMSCAFENSQLCTCLFQLANRMTNDSVAFPAVDPVDNTLTQIAQKVINTCSTRRRAVDVRTQWDAGTQPLSHLVMMFTFVLAMNCLFHALLYMASDKDSATGTVTKPPGGVTQGCLYLGFAGIVVLVGHLTLLVGSGGGHLLFMCIWMPASVLGMYWELSISWVKFEAAAAGGNGGKGVLRGFLHPMSFGMCLAFLMTYTMIARGVTQQEHLLGELFMVPGHTALYALALWYFSYGLENNYSKGDKSTVYTSEAYLLAVGTALVGTANNLAVPYPTQDCFELHYLFPTVFALVAFAIISWPSTMNLNRKPGDATSSAYTTDMVRNYFNDQGGVLIFLVAVAFLGLILERHTQVYLSMRAVNSFPTLVGYPEGVSAIMLPGMIKQVLPGS